MFVRSLSLVLLLALTVDLIVATENLLLDEVDSHLEELEEKTHTINKEQTEHESEVYLDNLENESIDSKTPLAPVEPLPAPRNLDSYHGYGNGYGYGGYGKGKGKGKGYSTGNCYPYCHQPPYQPPYQPPVYHQPPIYHPPHHPPPQTQPPPIPTHTGSTCYYLKNLATGKYLDNAAGMCNNGNNIQVWSFHGGVNQIWCDGPNNSIYSLCCPHMVLDLQGMSCNAGCNIHLYDYHGKFNQQFVYDGQRFINYSCNLAIDQSDYSSHDGGNVVAWNRGSSLSQCWEKQFV